MNSFGYTATCAVCGTQLENALQTYRGPDLTAYCFHHKPSYARAVDIEAPNLGVRRDSFQQVSLGGQVAREQPYPPAGSLLVEVPVLQRTALPGMPMSSGDPGLRKRLDSCSEHGVIALHNRSVPGYKATIAEIAVAPTGVYLIDVKYCRTRAHSGASGMSTIDRSPKSAVTVSERAQIALKMAWQMEAVRSVLDGLPEAAVAPGQPMLALVGARWSPLRPAIDLDGIYVASPQMIAKVVSRKGPLARTAISKIANRLAAELPVA